MPTSSSIVQTQVSIDGGPMVPAELVISRDIEVVRSLTATKPDMDWVYVDPNGHMHRFADDGTLPTLTSRLVEMPCDGSCGGVCGGEGYTEIEYSCSLCGAEVEPRAVPDLQAREFGTPIPGLWSATLTVREEITSRGAHVTMTGPSEEVPVTVMVGPETARCGRAWPIDRTVTPSGVVTVYDVMVPDLETAHLAPRVG